MLHKTTISMMKWLVLGVLFTPHVIAEPGDIDAPIKIEADQMSLDQAAGTSEYKGNVQLTQGTIKISATKLKVHNKTGQVTLIEMSGTEEQLASFYQLDNNGQPINGSAEHIQYHTESSHLILRGQAQLKHGSNEIKSGKIDYYTSDNNLVAGKPAKKTNDATKQAPPGRVQIIINTDSK